MSYIKLLESKIQLYRILLILQTQETSKQYIMVICKALGLLEMFN